LKDGVSPIDFDDGGNAKMVDLIEKFDTNKYYHGYATKNYPAISLLARIHFFGNG
jgi:hypothetical protein